MVEELHICEPPMDQRLSSAPTSWQCPDCASWWDIESSAPPEVPTTYDFLSHQGVVPAKWVRREQV